MGRKKSVVLMILLTIVIVALCALTAFPAFSIPGTVNKWNPVVLQYDLGAELGGGYYAYYYPEGVISETEYNRLDEEGQADYVQVAGSALYFSTDDGYNVVANGALTEDFKNSFNAAAQEISARFAKKGYSDYRVAVADGYSLRVELPASEPSDKASAALQYLALTGDVSIETGGAVVDELKGKEAKASDLIKSVSIGSRYKTSYLTLKFTSAGKEMIERVKSTLSATTDASSSTSTSSLTTLDIKVGEQTMAQIYSDNVLDNNDVRVMFVDAENEDYLKTLEIALDSALSTGALEMDFTISAVRSFEPVYGENALTLLYIALAVVLVALLVLPVVKMGRFGVVSGYSTLSYLIVTAICFAFITGGVFEVSLGTVAIFLAGLVLVNVMQAHIYGAIKKEFDQGKTVASSVKGGYKKTLWGIIDVYAVLLLGTLALLIGAAGLHTVALQAIICVVTGAFINLLWARAINFVFLSASKNKYKYFRFVREDDDDE